MNQLEFEALVNQGIAQIPKNFLKKLKNVVIVIEDEPSEEQKRKLALRPDSLLFGLYEGVPQTKRGVFYSALPDKITIFKKPIEAYAESFSQIKEIVKSTVWHEIAHHFGLDEQRVKKAEKRRGG